MVQGFPEHQATDDVNSIRGRGIARCPLLDFTHVAKKPEVPARNAVIHIHPGLAVFGLVSRNVGQSGGLWLLERMLVRPVVKVTRLSPWCRSVKFGHIFYPTFNRRLTNRPFFYFIFGRGIYLG